MVRNYRSYLVLILSLLIMSPNAVLAQTVSVKILRNDSGRIFEGIGGVSAGASSRLLYDYEEPYRSQILDYLFKPDFGANLQHLKVEIGCDANTTCGSEPSHARTPEEIPNPVYTRGYEYWLMAEAKKRNPDIIINALEWGVPGYIRSHWTRENAKYIIGFIAGADQYWGLKMDYISPGRNEDAISRDWLVNIFKPMLDSVGYGNVKIVAPDDDSDHWKVFDIYANDKDFLNTVDAVGYHYVDKSPSRYSTTAAKESGKSLWASEDWSETGAWQDAFYLAKILNLFYIRDRITMTSVWPPIDGIYNNLPHNDKGLMSADSPWSGNYTVEPAVWVMAHTNQFAKIGWQYLNHACAVLNNGGNYVTLKDPQNDNFSTIVVNGKTNQDFELDLSDWGKVKEVQIWITDSLNQFIKQKAKVRNNKILVNCNPNTIYTISSLKTSSKGDYSIPKVQSFQFPYADSFEKTSLSHPGKYFADLEGSFEVVNDSKRGHCLRQMLTGRPVDWTYDFIYEPEYPISIIGDTAWENYEVRCKVLIENKGTAGIHTRINSDCRGAQHGYQFKISDLGIWELRRSWGLVATGYFPYSKGKWYEISLSCKGNVLKASIDGKEVIKYKIDQGFIKNGMAGISSSYDSVCFDDFQVIK